MAGLVADYGSESESDDSDSSQKNNVASNEIVLPKPKFTTGCDDSLKERSVFINPFAEADKAEKAILEKHVKMISVDVKTLNGKKICWDYRKNKCRFGHNCKYAHDSDVQKSDTAIKPSTTNVKQINTTNVEVISSLETKSKKKKRPGAALNIIPSKKVMKHYNQQKNRILKCSKQ